MVRDLLLACYKGIFKLENEEMLFHVNSLSKE
jgi:hypothetical protein